LRIVNGRADGAHGWQRRGHQRPDATEESRRRLRGGGKRSKWAEDEKAQEDKKVEMTENKLAK